MPARLGWRPGLGTSSLLLVAVLFNAWFFTPSFWTEIGGDAKVFYATATVQRSGGDPYDYRAEGRAADQAFNAPVHRRPGEYGYVTPGAYAYPPLFTRLLAAGLWLGWPGFYFAGAAVGVVLAFLGLECLLRALAWRDRLWPRLFLLGATPLAQCIFDWNPGALQFAAWCAAYLLMARGRLAWGGACLSLLLLKPSVGLPAAAALLLTGVGGLSAGWAGRLRAAVGFALGTGTLLLANILVSRPGEMDAWVGSMISLGGGLGGGAGTEAVLRQTELAGLPALFMDHVGVIGATAVSAAVVAVLLAMVLRAAVGRRVLAAWPPLFTALGVAAALVMVPYLHVNDLLLEALPLLVLAGLRPAGVRRWTLMVWFAGSPLGLLGIVAFSLATHRGFESTAGFGLVFSALTLAALALAARDRQIEAQFAML